MFVRAGPGKGLFDMSKKRRERQRSQRRINRRNQTEQPEPRLDEKNSFGVTDPTPQGAVEKIRKEKAVARY